jgi:hypothetical protein
MTKYMANKKTHKLVGETYHTGFTVVRYVACKMENKVAAYKATKRWARVDCRRCLASRRSK